MKYKWIFNDQPKADFLSKNIDYSQIVKSLLFERGLNTLEKIESFFNPKYDRDLHDPFLLKDMDKACERVKRATGQNRKLLYIPITM